ncbi:MAG: radical SAM protein [Candidatus Omnitrophica bacterium]|nr:radical SAM protein [Candidatus Omnitrophota bacterium]
MSVIDTLRYSVNALNVFRKHEVPQDVIFFVTSRCNSNCYFCHFREQLGDKERRGRELTIDEVESIAKNFGQIMKLSLSGGEPFLRNDVSDIVKVFVDYCKPQIVDIPTNGSLPQVIAEQVEKILSQTEDTILEIQLSVDGLDKTHDKVRGVRGSYEKIFKTYKRLAEIRRSNTRLKIKMNLTYLPDNIEEIPALVSLFNKEYAFDRLQITFPHGSSIKNVTDQLSYKEFYLLSQKIQLGARIVNRRDLHSLLFRAIKIVKDQILLEALEAGTMSSICHAGEKIVVLDDIGNVYPCEPIWVSVGNLRDNGYKIADVLSSAAMNDFRKRYLGMGKCNCTWGCVALDRAIFSPKYFPKIVFYLLYLLFRQTQEIVW